MQTKTSIGIRANPSSIYYCIINDEADSYNLVILDKVVVPEAFQVPEKLKYIRSTFLDILREFNVTTACVRVTESTAQSPNLLRIGFEAVIQELFASSPIKSYFTGQISSISAKLSFNRDRFKSYVDGNEIFHDLENWPNYKPESREAILAATAALNLN